MPLPRSQQVVTLLMHLRERNWMLRMLSGALFTLSGLATVGLVYP